MLAHISGTALWVQVILEDLATSYGKILYRLYCPDVCRYPHYDNNPSFSDFEPFGGWSNPGVKQYAGDVTVCGKCIYQ